MTPEEIDVLIQDLERANRLVVDTERKGMLTVALLVLSVGGEIRVPKKLIVEASPALVLNRSDDPVTGEAVYTVREE